LVHWMVRVLTTNGAILAINLFTGVLSARVLGPERKGLYNALVLWPGVFSGLCNVGLWSAFTTVYARSAPEERPAVVRTAWTLGLAWGLAGAAACVLTAPRVLGHLGGGVRRWAVVGGLLVVPTNLTSLSLALLSIEEIFPWVNRVNLLRAAVLGALLGGLALLGALTPYAQAAAAWGVALGASLLAIGAAWWFGRRRGLWARTSAFRWAHARQLTKFGFGYYAIGLAAMFNAQLDQMLASAWLSARQIAFYAVALSAVGVVGAIGGAFAAVFFPLVAGDQAVDVVRRTNLALRLGVLVLGAATLGMLVAAKPVLWVLYGTRYLGAWPAVLALAPVAWFSGGINIIYQGCYALRLFAIPAVGEVVGALSGAALLALWIPRWGLVGAGLAGTVSYALDWGAVLWLWSHRQGGAGELVPRPEDLRQVVRLAAAEAGRLRARARGVWSALVRAA
jgi:O-antigen/teichoic acid export membrane protein